MEKYKTLEKCEPGDWVFYGCGELYQVMTESHGDTTWLELSNGYVRTMPSANSIVYPLTIENKIISELIRKRYLELYKHNCINGSKVPNWIDNMWYKIVTCVDTSERKKLWDELDKEVERLIDVRKQITELEKNFKY